MHDIAILLTSFAISFSCGFFFALAGYRRGCRSERVHWESMVDLLALNIQSAQLIDRTQMVNGDSILEALNAMSGHEIFSGGPDTEGET